MENNKLLERIGFKSLESLVNDFHAATKLSIRITGKDPNDILYQIGWTDFCAKYHRSTPRATQKCKVSNYAICATRPDPGEIRVRYCHNGMIHACLPIYIDGAICAYLFSGQVLFSPPDIEYFSSQAEKYGFDKKAYLKSVNQVAITDEDQIRTLLTLLLSNINLLLEKNRQLSRTQEKLEEQNQIIDKIAELLPIGLGVADNRKLVWTNEAMSRLTGYSIEELNGLESVHLFRRQEEYENIEQIEQHYREKGFSEGLAKGVKKDGSGIDALISSAPIGSPKLTGKVVFSVMDVTERVKAQKDLEDALNNLDTIARSARMGLWEMDMVTGDIDVSGPYVEIFGYDPDILPKTLSTWYSLLHPGDAEKSKENIKQLKAGQKSYSEECYRLRNPQGGYYWLSSKVKVVAYAEDGTPIRAVGIIQDITQAKLAALQKEEEDRKYREIFRHMSSAIAVLKRTDDNKFIVEDCNPASERISGIDYQDAVNRNLEELLSGPSMITIIEALQRVVDTQTPEWLEEQMFIYDQANLWGSHYIFPLSLNKVALIFNDYTEQKQAELQLQNQQEELEETNLTLRVLLKQYEQEKQNQEKKLAANVQMLVNPYLEKIKSSGLCDSQKNYLNIIETGLNDLSSPLAMISAARDFQLSKAETKVADLVRQGHPSKKIADILSISLQTVHKHRATIRKKLGVANQKVNLSTLLNQLN